jgi:hypothetical protein
VDEDRGAAGCEPRSLAQAGPSENPYEMTRAARDTRWRRLREQVLSENPDLSDAEVERAVRLLISAQMARLQLKRWPNRASARRRADPATGRGRRRL